jgi:hypothetical protein
MFWIISGRGTSEKTIRLIFRVNYDKRVELADNGRDWHLARNYVSTWLIWVTPISAITGPSQSCQGYSLLAQHYPFPLDTCDFAKTSFSINSRSPAQRLLRAEVTPLYLLYVGEFPCQLPNVGGVFTDLFMDSVNITPDGFQWRFMGV